MSAAVKKSVRILANIRLEEGIYDMLLEAGKMAEAAKPGQFISLYCKREGRLLPRPISICETDKEKGRIRLVYRVAGKGTKEFSELRVGDEIECIGPLGNGFALEGARALIIGGGIGIPPLLELAKQLKCDKKIILGYRDVTFLDKDFEGFGEVYIAAEDGSAGIKGNVMDVVKAYDFPADIIYACGPAPMLKAVKEYAESRNIKAQLSLEERMACGIGACLACVCRSVETDHHLNVRSKRVCKEGPVFYADEIIL